MNTIKRNGQFYIDGMMGGRRLRGSLGTKDKAVASRLKSRVELALAEGSRSENWVELRRVLPRSTYTRFAKVSGLKVEVSSTWGGLLSIFWKDRNLAANTVKRYEIAVETFSQFLALEMEGSDTGLSDITLWVVDQFKVWRRQLVSPASVGLECAILHGIFKIGVDRHMITKNPVRLEKSVERKVEPFTGEELGRLRDACETDLEKLVFGVLRHTGLRVSDAAALKWADVYFLDRLIRCRATKNGRELEIPVSEEFYHLLVKAEPKMWGARDCVLLLKNKSITTDQIRDIQRLISRRANVAKANPHRYRHSLATDLLMKGCSAFEVARILGDTTATVEKHYLSFVAPLQAKVKKMMDDPSTGLEAKGE